MLDNKVVLITGGTGSFGQEFVKHLLYNYKKIKKIIIFSRDELKQYEMEMLFPTKKYEHLRYFLGDVRDKERLVRACEGVNIIIHAAALKHVQIAEYNPIESIKTNILGAQNIIEASISQNVNKVIALSTDKATSPINLYGATKLCSEKLFSAANLYKGPRNIKFAIVRYGNVLNSRGSVVPNFLNQIKNNGILNITDRNMTRFTMTLKESIKLVMYAIKNMEGGEIFIPKIPSYKILDLAKAINSSARIKYTGIRPGEKYHEELITKSESYKTIENKNYYIIVPDFMKKSVLKKKNKAKSYFSGKSYSSDTNKFLSSKNLKKILKENKII
jgi:UDP-N-acetylglucosamine 4,6-dehydratase (inverting)